MTTVDFDGKVCTVLSKKELKKIARGYEFDGELIIEKSDNKTPFSLSVKFVNKLMWVLEIGKPYTKTQLISIAFTVYRHCFPTSTINLESAQRYLGVWQRIVRKNKIFGCIITVKENGKEVPYYSEHEVNNDNIVWYKKSDWIIIDEQQKDLTNILKKEKRAEALDIQRARDDINYYRMNLTKIRDRINTVLEK